MAKKPDTRDTVESIDLALRFKNDGGPVFAFLSSQKNSHMRGERVRQLLYLGLLREGELRGQAVGASTSAPTPDGQAAVPMSKGVQTLDVKQATESGSGTDFIIHADDLGEIFGSTP